MKTPQNTLLVYPGFVIHPARHAELVLTKLWQGFVFTKDSIDIYFL